MSSPFRYRVAELWHQCSELKRSDIFGTGDPLRPDYPTKSKLEDQVDVVAVGMVGSKYRPGGLAILSVNPAGGKSTYETDFNSDKMYEQFQKLRQSESRDQKLDNFEDANDAVIRSIRRWSITKRYISPILDAVGKEFDEIAYLYVVPFRTKKDRGSTMKTEYFERAYEKHLREQVELLAPKLVIAMDRPSQKMAERFKEERNPKLDVKYFTRKRDAHDERKEVLKCLRNYPI